MRKTLLACGSSLAAILAAGLFAGPSFAQPINETEVEGVVVTGTFIAGTPEDAIVPVEATTLEELRNQGSPSNLDLIKGISEIGSVAGEANRNNAFAIGSQSINLRSVSAARTVVVFNGRRFPEQYSAAVGRFNNVAQIPSAAIGRIEILKDGGATTFGADAVGGVVNYITRRNLDGVELDANYRFIEGSDGDWDASISAGRVGSNWNAMIVVGYQHRSELDLMERDWALRHYLENPQSWSSAGNPGAYVFQRYTGLPAGPVSTITPGGAGLSQYTGNRQMGSTGIVRDPSCSALGGFAGWSATPSAVCYFQLGQIQNLVEEQDTWQGYAEVNYEFSRWFEVHGELMYYNLDIPHVPIDNLGGQPGNFPINPPFAQAGGSNANGAQQTCTATASGCFIVPGTNPAVGHFLANFLNQNGSTAFTAAQIAALTAPTTFVTCTGAGAPVAACTANGQQIAVGGGRAALVLASWRPFGVGEHPYPEGDLQHNFSTIWRYTLAFGGDIPSFLGFDLRWDLAATYNQLEYTIEYQDMLVERLQAALNGLGGPNCTGTTPGANGCGYFNPFSSAIAGNVHTGAANPMFVGTGSFTGYLPGQGLQNDPALVRWLYVPLSLYRTNDYEIYDFVINGTTPLRFWAEDPVAIAFGAQYRRIHEVTDLSDLSDRSLNPCGTVGVQTCTSRTGPLVFNRGLNVTGLTIDADREYPVAAAFFEVRAPITDTFTANVSGRWERFFSDVTDVDNEVFVMAGGLRWQATSWLTLRATASESFSQVNPPANNCVGPPPPGQVSCPVSSVNVAAPTQFGGSAVLFSSNNYPNLEVRPETGFNYNIGAVVQVGNFRGSIDYYNIEIDDIIRAQTTAQLVQAVLVPDQPTPAVSGGWLINCSSELITVNQPLMNGNPFVILNGPCVQGSSRLNSTGAGGIGGLAGNGSFVNIFGAFGTQPALVNGGSLSTSGIDLSGVYRFDDLWGGVLTVSADATWVLTYEASDFVVAGISVAPGFDGIGSFNEATGKNGQHVARYRGSISFNYSRGRHNLNWTTRMVSSFVDDDIAGNFSELLTTNPNIGDGSGVVPTSVGCVDLNPVAPPVPAGAGSGVFGSVGPSGGAFGNAVGYNACQNLRILSGQKVPATFNTDISYRLELPWQTTFTFTVQNLFDEDPQFSRDIISYDAFTGSPLGRTFRIGVRKTF